MYCRFCGKEVGENDLFCSSCGRPIKEEQRKESEEIRENTSSMSSRSYTSNLSSPTEKKPNLWKLMAAVLGGICVLLIVVLVVFMGDGSSSQFGDDLQEDGQYTAGQPDWEEEPDQGEPDQAEESDDVSEASRIITDYYSLTVPSSWEGKYAYEIYQPEEEWSEAYYLDVYHKESEQENYGGSLFGISLLYDGDSSYLDYPAYEVLGRLQIKEASIFEVVVTYPTDVQFTDETEAGYRELREDVEEVLASFEADSKYTFTPADGT